jgi:hypothetical protein
VHKIKNKIPVTDYLRGQKRFRHLFGSDSREGASKKLQALADTNIAKFNLDGRSGGN